MNIRQLVGEELEQQYYVWSQAFEHGKRDMSEWREDDAANSGRQAVYGVFDKSGLQATFLIVNMRLHFGPHALVPMGAVNGVAVLPGARGKGYASEGIRYYLRQMRAAGQVVSILEPFSWDYYRGLGYEWIGLNRRYAVPSRLVPPSAETAHVRAATPQDLSAIRNAYTQYAIRYRGMLQRVDSDWKTILEDKPKEHTYTYVYERDGDIEGYITYHGGKREETRLREFLYLTGRAQKGLLGLLRRHDMQIDKFTWNAPGDDTLYSQLTHWDVETKLRPCIMGRIVDVVGALQAWKPLQPTQVDFVLQVEDKHAPWNQGRWRITSTDGQTTVTTTNAVADLEMDIQALTQAYFGTPSVAELRRAERLTIHTEHAAEQLAQLLDGPPMWVNDGF